MAWVVPLPARLALRVEARRLGGVISPAAGRLPLRVEARRAAGWCAVVGVPKAAAPVEPPSVVPALPAAWQAAALGAGGFIGPVSAQLALLRGAAAVFDAGGLLIGGKRLIGPAGKVFAFSGAAAAGVWAAINLQRATREIELWAAMDAAAAAAFRARKQAEMARIAAAVVAAAGRLGDAARAAALVAESDFLLIKWG